MNPQLDCTIEKSSKARVYITQEDNDNYFKQNLSTWSYGFCWIERIVKHIQEIDGELYGIVYRHKAKPLVVYPFSNNDEWEIYKELED